MWGEHHQILSHLDQAACMRQSNESKRLQDIEPETSPVSRISGLVVEYIVAIDVARVRFPADAFAGMRHQDS